MSETDKKTLVLTRKVRFSYAHVFEPKAAQEGGKPKYSVSLLIPKSDTETIEEIEAAIEAAKEIGKASIWDGKVPKGKAFHEPLRDGDEEREDDPAYKDCYFINANSHTKPGVVDRNVKDIIDPEEFYSGCYGRATVNFYPFNTSGKKGVAAGLNNLQKLADGEKLAGGTSAVDDFSTPYEEEDDDDIL